MGGNFLSKAMALANHFEFALYSTYYDKRQIDGKKGYRNYQEKFRAIKIALENKENEKFLINTVTQNHTMEDIVKMTAQQLLPEHRRREQELFLEKYNKGKIIPSAIKQNEEERVRDSEANEMQEEDTSFGREVSNITSPVETKEKST